MDRSNEPSRPTDRAEEDATRTYYRERYMSYPQLTASRLELAATCPGSFAHEHLHITNEFAKRGQAIHDYIAALLDEDEAIIPAEPKAAALCRNLDHSELVATARPNTYSTLHAEQGMYLLPASLTGVPGEAGLLDGEYHRDYSDAPEGSIPGTADALAVEDARVRITDWKSGATEVSRPHENPQLMLLALASARIFERPEAIVQIAYLRADGSVALDKATFDADELTSTEREISRVYRQVQAAREGEPVYQVGSHCRFCPVLTHCPAIAEAAQALMNDLPEDELTPRRAAESWSRLQAVEAAAKRTREAIKEYAYARPVPTSEGRELRVVETSRQSIEPLKALPILREYLPDDTTLAEVLNINKSSLSAAFDGQTRNEVLGAFEEAGALQSTYAESLREVRS